MLLMTPSLACDVSEDSARSAEMRMIRVNFEGIVVALVGNGYSDKYNAQSIVAKHRWLGFRRDCWVIRPSVASVAQEFLKHCEVAHSDTV
jgi:hypothetical protein